MTNLETSIFIFITKHPKLSAEESVTLFMQEHPITKSKEWDVMEIKKQNAIIAKLTKRWNNLKKSFPKQYGVIYENK